MHPITTFVFQCQIAGNTFISRDTNPMTIIVFQLFANSVPLILKFQEQSEHDLNAYWCVCIMAYIGWLNLYQLQYVLLEQWMFFRPLTKGQWFFLGIQVSSTIPSPIALVKVNKYWMGCKTSLLHFNLQVLGSYPNCSTECSLFYLSNRIY